MTSETCFTIAILNYTGVQASAVYGLTDLLEVANRCRAEQVKHLSIQVKCISAEDELPQETFAAIILPPSLEDASSRKSSQQWSKWLIAQHQQGALLCSVCAGVFLLAQTNLLEGRTITTHWDLGECFAQQYPKVLLDTDQMVIDDNDIVTAGGMMAWLDLGLRLIERFLGAATMVSVASFFLIDPSGREQRFYSSFSPPLLHGDKQVIKVQHWLQTNSHEDLMVKDMAVIANLTERTLLRRFKKTTGYTPSEYIQQLRMNKAREMLKLSQSNIDEIAWQVGYRNTNSFHRVFHKIVGLTPNEYRNRFASYRQTM